MNDVEALERRLRLYKYNQEKIDKWQAEIDGLYDQLGGYKSPPFDREPVHSPKNLEQEYEVRERIAILEERVKRLSNENAELDQILAKVQTSLYEAVKQRYIDGVGLREMEKMMNYSYSQINRMLKMELMRIISR